MESAQSAMPEDVHGKYERVIKKLQEAHVRAMLELLAGKKLDALLGRDEN